MYEKSFSHEGKIYFNIHCMNKFVYKKRHVEIITDVHTYKDL